MSMLHLRVVCPDSYEDEVLALLHDRTGVVAVFTGTPTSHGAVVHADLAREAADAVLADLRRAGVVGQGMIALDPIDAAFGSLVAKAEHDAPGEGVDAVIWDELTERIGEDSTLSWTFLAFIVLATMLSTIGIVTDSQVTLLGAMVVGPEFGPLAGLAIGLVRRRPSIVRASALALVVGFAVAIIAVALLSALGRGVGLLDSTSLLGRTETDFIYHPGWFSLIVAVLAGITGILSLSSAKSAALVGVFISVTTIPAAGNAAVAGVLGDWHETWLSLLQLAINLVGITVAGVLTLLVRAGLPKH